MKKELNVAVIGTGPAALMAADVMSSAGISVSIFEKRKTPARKLLIAGSSGLNVTHHASTETFISKYSGPRKFWEDIFTTFDAKDWLAFIHQLGIKTFKGTSDRFFVEGMKAGNLVSVWKKRLSQKRVKWYFNHDVMDFKLLKSGDIKLSFKNNSAQEFTAIVFCLGGASWEPADEPVKWPEIFQSKGLAFTPFTSSNVGFNVKWSTSFLKEAEGLPLKNILLKTKKGLAQGDIVITRYGMEGTPVYAVGIEGKAKLDLKPELSTEAIFEKVSRVKENMTPLRKIQKQIKLGDAALALLFHETPNEEQKDLNRLIQRIKNFPIDFNSRQNLERAISSAGGLQIKELDDKFMLKKFPGIFVAGEMLDWDTITGGFLIQACVSQGFCAGNGVLNFFKNLGE